MASSRGQVNILESSRCSLMRTPPQRDAVGSRWDQARCVHSRATPRVSKRIWKLARGSLGLGGTSVTSREIIQQSYTFVGRSLPSQQTSQTAEMDSESTRGVQTATQLEVEVNAVERIRGDAGGADTSSHGRFF